MPCRPKSIKSTLNNIFSVKCCLEFLGQYCTSSARLLPVRNAGPWLTDKCYEKNNLYNVVSTIPRQICIEILFSQCCPNTSETILDKEFICAMFTQSAQTCFCRKMTYIIQCCLDLPVPTLHKKELHMRLTINAIE